MKSVPLWCPRYSNVCYYTRYLLCTVKGYKCTRQQGMPWLYLVGTQKHPGVCRTRVRIVLPSYGSPACEVVIVKYEENLIHCYLQYNYHICKTVLLLNVEFGKY